MEQAVCDRCERSALDVGNLTQYQNHGVDKLLCSDCISELDEYYSITCDRCGKPAHLRGNMLEYKNEKICPVCMDEIRLKES